MNSANLKRQLEDFLESESCPDEIKKATKRREPVSATSTATGSCSSSKSIVHTTNDDDVLVVRKSLYAYENASFSNLPHEILLHIFRVLNIQDVCKMAR